MKKITITIATLFSLLGIIYIAQAAVPTVSAGVNQTITLPASTATLTGSATPVAPATSIASYMWTQTSGPISSVIATPSAPTTLVSGLTIPGNYVFTLTATDNGTPASIGTSTVTITVNMAQNPLPVINKKMKLEITPSGQVNLQGVLDSITNGKILTVKVWGILFSVDTTNARFGYLANDLALYKVGDVVKVNGVIDTTTSVPTINARKISNISINNNKDKKDREDERKHEDEMNREDGNNFPSLDRHNQNGKNKDNGNKGKEKDDN